MDTSDLLNVNLIQAYFENVRPPLNWIKDKEKEASLILLLIFGLEAFVVVAFLNLFAGQNSLDSPWWAW